MTADGATDGTRPSSGDLNVLVEAEDTITDGIAAGDSGEAIQDGWSATFDEYVVVIGDIDVHFSTDQTLEVEAAALFAVDLTKVPESGLLLWSLDGLETGRWELNYAIGGAGGAMRHESADEASFAQMMSDDATYFIRGAIANSDGESCPPASLAEPPTSSPENGNTKGPQSDPCYDASSISFAFAFGAETVFGPCEVDEQPGFAVTEGSSTTVALTIHGDHLFFNGFPEGAEGGVQRLAQWLADSDLNLDGEVTRAELEQLTPSDLVEFDSRFQLGGAPITLNTMWDYVVAQGKTQGHFQGEGECPVDGVAHEHQ